MKSAFHGWIGRQREPRRLATAATTAVTSGLLLPVAAAPFRKLKWNVRSFLPFFFSAFNRNTQRVYPCVRGPRQKEELARTNGKEILLGVGARKFIAAPAVESLGPREVQERGALEWGK